MKSNNSPKQWKARFNARFKNAHFRYRMQQTKFFRSYPVKRFMFLIGTLINDGLPF